ncbi:MAG: phosphate acetyltransferase, partial [Acidobacteria bacterium]|nr:phosphate acetyltransferase [Acidobacteriota bacterium]
MNILEQLRRRAKQSLKHIVLPEGEDPRTVVAASMCAREHLARITILGSEEKIRSLAQANQADLGGVEVIDHRRASDFERMVQLYHELRRAKGMMPD